jgi:signal transduction histidine kinase
MRILKPEDVSDDDLRVPAKVLYRVLLVHRKRDENAVVLHHLETTTCDDFEFSSVSSASEALAKLKEEPFDLAVLALDLPEGQELDGFESLKKAFPDLPVVILSNTKNRDLAISAVKRGAHDFLLTNSSYPIELVKLRLLYSIERSRTERAARSLAKTEKFALRSVVENSPLMFLRLDHSYTIRDCNKNFSDVLQTPRSQLRRRSLFDFLPDFKATEIDHLSTGDQLIHKAVTLTDSENGHQSEVYWNCFGWPFYKSNSEEREIIVVAIDVTREVLLDQFREEFLAAVAHDIKNPVVGQERILSALLKANPDLPPDVTSSLTTLRNSGLQLLNLLSTLVEIYRLDSGDIASSSGGASLNEATEIQLEELLCIAIASERDLITDFEKDLPMAAIDSTAAYRLVANLIHNALQNAEPKTRIIVKTYSSEKDVTLEVNNQGPPIKPAALAKLFQRFSRTSNGAIRANSSGLGLYLCKQTVEKCGGTIMCISDETTGTTFVVKLPRADS